MEQIQLATALIALVLATITITATLIAIWWKSDVADKLLELAKLLLSWPVVGGAFVFGGGVPLIQALRF